jgi:hypothetical protein
VIKAELIQMNVSQDMGRRRKKRGIRASEIVKKEVAAAEIVIFVLEGGSRRAP